jgi:acyl phosphate:glycerol-3-phosphate acyltransferase
MVWLALPVGYLLGSIPSAVIVTRRVAGVDIRTLGDGNMGARNVKRSIGWRPAIAVAAMDFTKGSAAVLLAQALGLSAGWQVASGAAALAGHGFPLFAGFRGGQGLATTLGVLLGLSPVAAATGLCVYGIVYLLTRHSDLSAGIGVGLMFALLWVFEEPPVVILGSLGMILFIPGKMLLDRAMFHRVAGA